jgi:hypothetical protein
MRNWFRRSRIEVIRPQPEIAGGTPSLDRQVVDAQTGHVFYLLTRRKLR